MSDLEFDPFGPTGAPLPNPENLSMELQAIRAQQDAFTRGVDKLIEVYRAFDQTKRIDIKRGLKGFYEEFQKLGETIGISRISLDHLWAG